MGQRGTHAPKTARKIGKTEDILHDEKRHRRAPVSPPEPVHAGLEDRLVFVAGDVAGDVRAAAFAMGHLAEDAGAGAEDAFGGEDGFTNLLDPKSRNAPL